jgi:hypothetical protein
MSWNKKQKEWRTKLLLNEGPKIRVRVFLGSRYFRYKAFDPQESKLLEGAEF